MFQPKHPQKKSNEQSLGSEFEDWSVGGFEMQGLQIME